MPAKLMTLRYQSALSSCLYSCSFRVITKEAKSANAAFVNEELRLVTKLTHSVLSDDEIESIQ